MGKADSDQLDTEQDKNERNCKIFIWTWPVLWWLLTALLFPIKGKSEVLPVEHTLRLAWLLALPLWPFSSLSNCRRMWKVVLVSFLVWPLVAYICTGITIGALRDAVSAYLEGRP
jgi:hypothetical protein